MTGSRLQDVTEHNLQASRAQLQEMTKEFDQTKQLQICPIYLRGVEISFKIQENASGITQMQAYSCCRIFIGPQNCSHEELTISFNPKYKMTRSRLQGLANHKLQAFRDQLQ